MSGSAGIPPRLLALVAPVCAGGFAALAAATLAFAAGSVPGAAATGTWTTSGNQILTPAGGQFIITGINWYGFETTSEVAHGLYTPLLDRSRDLIVPLLWPAGGNL